jgi:hypothetical protein
MSWSLSASGHAASEEAEREFAEKLGEILSDPKYGASVSWFGGSYVRGALDLIKREV